jgi:adenine-specific DNA methylase
MPVPDEALDTRGIRHTSAMIYGMERWGDLFTPRQALTLATLAEKVGVARVTIQGELADDLSDAVQACLGLAVNRLADALSSLVTWTPGGEFQGHTFARQALPMVWDFAEVNPWCDSSGNFMGAVEWIAKVCEANGVLVGAGGHVEQASAVNNLLPDNAADAVINFPGEWHIF